MEVIQMDEEIVGKSVEESLKEIQNKKAVVAVAKTETWAPDVDLDPGDFFSVGSLWLIQNNE